jgi:DNA repair photolyase
VTRDLDLLLRLKDRVRISMTVETDMESVRKAFTPSAPPIAARLSALRKLTEAGLRTQAAVSPVLPSSPQFAGTIAAATRRVCVDDFFMGDGSSGRRTEQLGIRTLFEKTGYTEWYDRERYKDIVEALGRHFPPERVKVSQSGFLPDSSDTNVL